MTFDDGPWPGSTGAVLKALADQCLKAVFFEVGEYARWHPEITKQAVDAGMTVGTQTADALVYEIIQSREGEDDDSIPQLDVLYAYRDAKARAMWIVASTSPRASCALCSLKPFAGAIASRRVERDYR